MSQKNTAFKAKLNRRHFMKGAGLATVGGASATIANTVQAQNNVLSAAPSAGPEHTPLKRPKQVPQNLPSLEIIALNRLAFGPRPGDLAVFRALGASDEARLEAYVDAQLAPDFNDDPALLPHISAANFETLSKTMAQLWADHVVNNNNGWSYRLLPFTETRHVTFLRAVYSKWQLFEVLADFWHNHFNVRANDGNIGPAFVQYDRDVIRGNAFGNFRTMLEAVATSTSMLYYLDNYLNEVGGPNENYARELFELHTLGAENYLGSGIRQKDVQGYDEENPIGYVDDDVYEATRCFTGWRVSNSSSDAQIGNTGEFLYYNPWHDRFQKTVLGKFIESDQDAMQDGRDVLDVVAKHPGTGRYIARKLCRRLISDTPPDDLVNDIAALFTANWQNPDQLKIVTKALIMSDEFRSTWGQKIKRPFEVIASTLRATQANFTEFEDFRWNYGKLGQPLFEWGPPTGYPDDSDYWSSTVPTLQRWRLCTWLIDSWEDDDDNLRIDLLGQMPAQTRSANAVVDFWLERILGRSISAADRTTLLEFMAAGVNPDIDLDFEKEEIQDRLRSLVSTILNFPDFQWR